MGHAARETACLVTHSPSSVHCAVYTHMQRTCLECAEDVGNHRWPITEGFGDAGVGSAADDDAGENTTPERMRKSSNYGIGVSIKTCDTGTSLIHTAREYGLLAATTT